MNVVFAIHVAFIVALLIVPFLPVKRHRHNLEFYSLIIPFLFFHWSVNDDTCALTQMEMRVTGRKKHETVFQRIVGPIYNMPDDAANNFMKSVLFTLWFLVQFRLGRFEAVENDLKKILRALQ